MGRDFCVYSGTIPAIGVSVATGGSEARKIIQCE